MPDNIRDWDAEELPEVTIHLIKSLKNSPEGFKTFISMPFSKQ